MRDLHRISLAIITTIALVQPVFATEMAHGDMVAIIRSADYPCQRVLELQDTANDSWRVQCNSGVYLVSRDANGQFSVAKAN